MRVKNRFDETKIKLAMKFRGLTREKAIKELDIDINRLSDGADERVVKHSVVRKRRPTRAEHMSIEEFLKI